MRWGRKDRRLGGWEAGKLKAHSSKEEGWEAGKPEIMLVTLAQP
jgi:hypothetical protein